MARVSACALCGGARQLQNVPPMRDAADAAQNLQPRSGMHKECKSRATYDCYSARGTAGSLTGRLCRKHRERRSVASPAKPREARQEMLDGWLTFSSDL
jgi:hypothetical protein